MLCALLSCSGCYFVHRATEYAEGRSLSSEERPSPLAGTSLVVLAFLGDVVLGAVLVGTAGLLCWPYLVATSVAEEAH
ncbi:MAG: hypothetical protein ACAI25_20655 [Planctomycetota bacterium]